MNTPTTDTKAKPTAGPELFQWLKDSPIGTKVSQGNREFLKVGDWAWYITKVDGKYYHGKSFSYSPCEDCGQLVSHMFGGSARHFKTHSKKATE